MRIVARYLTRQTLPVLLLFGGLACLLVWLLQLLRLGPHLAAALRSPADLTAIVVYSLPTVLSSTFPFAIIATAALCCARLRASGELEAMQAMGARPSRTFAGLAAPLLAATCIVYGVAGPLEPAMLGQLQKHVSSLAASSLIARLEPDRFGQLSANTAVYLHTRRQISDGRHELGDVVLATDDLSVLVSARHAMARVGPAQLSLTLTHGEAQLSNAEAPPTQLRFDTLRFSLPLAEMGSEHLSFISRIATPWRAAALAATCSSFATLALALFLWLSVQQALWLTAVAVMTHEAAIWVLTLRLPSATARLCVALTALALTVAASRLLRPRRRRAGRRETGSATRSAA